MVSLKFSEVLQSSLQTFVTKMYNIDTTRNECLNQILQLKSGDFCLWLGLLVVPVIRLWSNCTLIIFQCADVPCWMFLGWVNQIIALIDKPLQKAVMPILKQIARSYPQAIMFPLKVSSVQYQFENTPDGKRRKAYFDKWVQQPLFNYHTSLNILYARNFWVLNSLNPWVPGIHWKVTHT